MGNTTEYQHSEQLACKTKAWGWEGSSLEWFELELGPCLMTGEICLTIAMMSTKTAVTK